MGIMAFARCVESSRAHPSAVDSLRRRELGEAHENSKNFSPTPSKR